MLIALMKNSQYIFCSHAKSGSTFKVKGNENRQKKFRQNFKRVTEKFYHIEL